MTEKRIILVSACLAGLQTRYDGRLIASPACLRRLNQAIWLPICPEQLGGLPTPRCAADLVGGDGADVLAGRATVVCSDGSDVTRQFVNGARQVLEIALRQAVSLVCLKARSPSCGVTRLGVTAALLAEHGLDLEEFD